MPHFVFEYSRGIEERYDISRMMQIAREGGIESGVMQAADIKTRARAYDDFEIQQAEDSFVHLTLFLLAGRTDRQKEKVGLILRDRLTEYLTDVTSVSIDIRDMNTVAYKKRVLGSG